MIRAKYLQDETLLRDQIVATARTFLDTKWTHQGRVLQAGIDCIGLLTETAKGCSLDVEDYPTDYQRAPQGDLLVQAMNDRLVPIATSLAKPGDILTFWFDTTKRPSHVALVTPLGIIHTYDRIGRVVEHSLSSWWKQRVFNAYEFRQISALKWLQNANN